MATITAIFPDVAAFPNSKTAKAVAQGRSRLMAVVGEHATLTTGTGATDATGTNSGETVTAVTAFLPSA